MQRSDFLFNVVASEGADVSRTWQEAIKAELQ